MDRARSLLAVCFVSLASLALGACGGAQKGEAKGPESDVWAGYKGTYATSAGASGSSSTRLKSAQADNKVADKPEAVATQQQPVTEAAAADPQPAPAPVAAPPAKKKGKAAAKPAAKKAAKP